MYFVSEYSVTRSYGGPEEGGWWYDWDEFVKIVAITENIDDGYAICQAMNARQREIDKQSGHVDRFSSRGESDTVYLLDEDLPGSNQSVEKPIYE